jgi:DNA processing protein
MPYSEQANIITLQSVQGIGNATLNKLLTKLRELNLSFEDLQAMSADELRQTFSISAKIAQGIASVNWTIGQQLEGQLRQRQMHIITLLDKQYPQRLQERLQNNTPPILYAFGNLALLDEPLLAISGSRNASEQGLAHTANLIKNAVADNYTIVSGNAKGIDTIAHETALEAGGNTIFVMPEGILRARLNNATKEKLKSNLAGGLVLSEFPPNLTWSGRNAMIRNQTILGLSDAVCVIEAGDSGGTLNAGKTALKQGVPLFILDYGKDVPESAVGNAMLINQGGYRLPVTGDLRITLTENMPANQRPQQLDLL